MTKNQKDSAGAQMKAELLAKYHQTSKDIPAISPDFLNLLADAVNSGRSICCEGLGGTDSQIHD